MQIAPLRFKRLTIQQLFGPSSSDIDIEFRLKERVTVLHGRNGSGKTITLGLIDALREENFAEFIRYPFKLFRLELSDGRVLELEHASPEETTAASEYKQKKRRKTPPRGIRYSIYAADHQLQHHGTIEPMDERSGKRAARLGRGRRLWIEHIGDDLWIDNRTGEKLTTDEAGERYPEILQEQRRNEKRSNQADASVLSGLIARLPAVKYIRADRLFVRGAIQDEDYYVENFVNPSRIQEARTGLMVERLSKDIRKIVFEADREYRLISTRLDSSLPKRLFESDAPTPTLEELRGRSQDLRLLSTRLRDLGLLREAPDVLEETALTDTQRGTFSIILNDREEKLRPFSAVLEKAQRLLDSLNRKLAPKSVRLDVESGYKIESPEGKLIPLECLSSGEQHELVLLHELLFDVKPESLILIDEPELSLHVTWQVDLLNELLEIAKLSQLDFVLATHSPYIVQDNDGLMVRLGSPV